MPLDGHAHLVAQGWSGKGTGLRSGAIAKPITIIQKKSLAGVGKDRDEAFPFWDHVFQAASVSIQVKVHNSDDESDSEGSTTPALSLQRTKTGIISNRRPTTGTPALSGTTTPSEPQSSGAVTPRLSIMAQAKQQAARRMLYSMFYRGPVLSTEDVEKTMQVSTTNSPEPSSASAPLLVEKASKESKRKKRKKRKSADVEDEGKAKRKRRKREPKEKERNEKRSESKGKEKAPDDDDSEDARQPRETKAARKAEKAERKRLKAEKRARKEERRKRRAARKAKEDAQSGSESGSQETSAGGEVVSAPTQKAEKSAKRTRNSSDTSLKDRRASKKAKKS
ncbi:hypothetical protein BD309DRAFT_958301 [Dichomitus squalens]|uniref:Uncharacterized protein n=1 Tax=Dichomitus squalens TaxID=114155 RepID=A0A4Q9NT41_9APHY|nr:hypothetical protein BD309DRAFT_958301 [Dichomitus squalens]TBU54640.1 hypothetical protein BD310DRAFT_935444 [Dichomitus squalens]